MGRPFILSVRRPFGRRELWKCDKCRSALKPKGDWPVNPRQGYIVCPTCGDLPTKYVRRVCEVCEGAGCWSVFSAGDEVCVSCGGGGYVWCKPAGEG